MNIILFKRAGEGYFLSVTWSLKNGGMKVIGNSVAPTHTSSGKREPRADRGDELVDEVRLSDATAGADAAPARGGPLPALAAAVAAKKEMK